MSFGNADFVESVSAYIPMDRRQALAQGRELPDRMQGAALFADISGFTPLTEALVRELGPQRGAEELTQTMNRVYDALIETLHHYGGSVIGFSGDAITCWFDSTLAKTSSARIKGSDAALSEWILLAALQAVTCALAMQRSLKRFAAVTVPSGKTMVLAMKAAVAAGPVRRFLVGDPGIQLIDTLAGATLHRLSSAEHHAMRGEVVIDQATMDLLGEWVDISEWREDVETGQVFGVVVDISSEAPPHPWAAIDREALSKDQVRPWLSPPVYERLSSGMGEFLAEFRPVVMLFLRFGGINYDGDPQAGGKLAAYIRWVQRVISDLEGFLLQITIGDKGSYLCIAFGAPVAHEDDPVRAVKAALALQNPPEDLSFAGKVQIGIAQGQMRTGAYGAITQRTYGVMGDEINLAARLMQAAAPGQVLASRRTSLAAEESFLWESLPDMQVKGKSEPVAVCSLVGTRQRTARQLVPSYALPMVGRQAELGLIQSKIKDSLDGRGQVVGITGEAGLGKSRLVSEAVHLIEDQPFASYVGEAESYGTNTSYLAWQNIWRAFFGLEQAWSIEEQVSALEKELRALSVELAPRFPLLGIALNLPIQDNDLTRAFDAKLRKTSMEGLLIDCLRLRAQERPILLILEDCQWLDPLSQDLLEAVGRAIAGLPVMLLVVYRPPQASQAQVGKLSLLSNFTEIRLAEFTDEEAEHLARLKLEQIYGSQAGIPSEVITQIINRADGNPFYLEELMNYLKGRGIDPHDPQALEQLTLPTSLHSLILSRIDQLNESQVLTLKVASVIGRLFRAATLWGIYPQLGDSRRVISDLESLRQMDLMELEAADPELTYMFKHIVTQEVTYESLPYATRATLHELIGKFIETSFPETQEQYLDLLAFHYGRSQNEGKKREYLLRAGRAAQANYANTAAINYYQKALPLLPLKEQPEVLLKLGQVLVLVGRWREAGELYERTLKLAEELGDGQARAWCQAAAAELLSKQGQYSEAAEGLEQAKAAFEALGDLAGIGQTLHAGGTLAAQRGDYERAGTLYERSLEIRRQLNDRPRIASLLGNLAILGRFRGDYPLARKLHEEALAIRRDLGDKWAIANSLNNLGNVALDQGDYVEARAWLEEAVKLQREVGDRWALANSLNNLGNVTRAQDDYPAARMLYQESLRMWQEFDDKRSLAYLLEDMAGLAAKLGKAEPAITLVGSAAGLRIAIGSPLYPTEQLKLDQLLKPAMEILNEIQQATAWGEGMGFTLEQAVTYANSI